MAWIQIENALKHLLAAKNMFLNKAIKDPTRATIRAVGERRFLSPELIQLLLRMQTLRDTVANADVEPSRTAVEDQLLSASRLLSHSTRDR